MGHREGSCPWREGGETRRVPTHVSQVSSASRKVCQILGTSFNSVNSPGEEMCMYVFVCVCMCVYEFVCMCVYV